MHKRMRRTSVAALVSAVGLSLTVASPMAMSKESMKDDSWVTLSGTITKVDDEGEEFTLDYGSGSIRVEVEDWSWGDRPDRIRQGDRVTVNGRVDDDLFQSKEIDAESVYDEGRGAFYYRSDFGNAKGPRVSYSGAPDQLEDDYWITLTGTVSEIDNPVFYVHAGGKKIRIDTSHMRKSPLRKEAERPLEVGDRVQISGVYDDGFFKRGELDAGTIVRFEANPGSYWSREDR